jgi:membrane-associated phospholipid phosphatase
VKFFLFIFILNIYIKPVFPFDKKEKKCGFFCISSIALTFSFSLDEKFREINLKKRYAFEDNISKFFEPFGRRGTGFYLSSFSLFYGFLKKEDKFKILSLNLAEVVLLSDLSSNLLQKTFGRQRPYKTENNSHKFFNGGNSFPSSHSIHSFAYATILSENFPKMKYLFYSISTLTSISRVLDDKHWTSDVVFGAIVGYLSGKIILYLNKKQFFLIPNYEKNKYSLIFSFKLNN